MICKLQDARPDWKSYALGELDAEARREAELHAAACDACQEELAGLRVTLDALSTLREEEVPRRIAFVSDKVFEPKWWQSFLRPSFAAGAVVAAAILVHAFVRPPAPGSGSADSAAIEARVTAAVLQGVQQRVATEVDRRVAEQLSGAVDQAVTKAVAETQRRDDQRTVQLLTAAEQRYSETAEILNKQVTQIYAMNTGAGVR
jgi:anti-sigma factor RsiW